MESGVSKSDIKIKSGSLYLLKVKNMIMSVTQFIAL